MTHHANTEYTKTTLGWVGLTKISLGKFDGNPYEHVLKIRTAKDSRGYLRTTASVSRIERDGWETHVMFQDFHATVACTDAGRVTQKAIEAEHGAIDQKAVIKRAREFYAEMYSCDAYRTV